MNSNKCVFSLTYHEVTQDPRVLKQARALSSGGYNVHVFCDFPQGLPQEDHIDGVNIKRFRCFDQTGGGHHILENLDFLSSALPQIQKRYIPFANACDAMRIYERTDSDVRLFKSYYKKYSGWPRFHRKVQHQIARYNLWLRKIANPQEREVVKDARAVDARFRELFQTLSLLFAANIDRQHFSVRPDIIHAHDIYTLPAGVMLARRYGAKLVYDAHEYEPARATKQPEDGGALAALLENDCFKYVDAMITVSESIAHLYAARYAGPIEVVMNSPELSTGRVSAPSSELSNLSVRASVGLEPHVPLLVFTGGIGGEHRGLDKVVAALPYLDGFHLAILGPRVTRSDRWLMECAKSAGVQHRLHLAPSVDARQVPNAISSANIAIIPMQDMCVNHKFAMPNKLFEAAFAGLPLCVSDLPEMRKFVETLGIGRTMDQTDPAKIAEAIRDVYENRSNYQATEASRERLLEEYSWAAQQEKLLSLYAGLSSTHFRSASGTQSDRSEIVTST